MTDMTISGSGLGEHDAQLDDPKAATLAELEIDESYVSKKLGLGFWLSALWLVLVVGAAILAPWLPIKGAEDIDVINARSGPSGEFLFGTDDLGRDGFARAIWGARTSLTVGFASIVFGMLVGGTLGISAGFIGGWFDKVVNFLFLLLLSIPSLILAIFILNTADKTLFWITMVIGIVSIAPIGRLARAQTLNFAEREFVSAARALGAKKNRIMWREILPNVMMPMLALALLAMAIAIVAEGTLSYIGLGPEGTSDSWGKIIQLGTSSEALRVDAPWVAGSAILMVFFTVLALNYMGDQLRKMFEVKDIPL